MNEQIQQILNGTGTKTAKIQQLLNLGLTRREVANLVTNGNYGFVQNVYARMMRAIAQTAGTVEFRQHSGSTNFTKMSAWIHFIEKMITFAQAGTVQPRTTLENIPFLSDTEKLYFRLRTRKLAA